jgi:predicted DNA-binding mobile mystery protein A
LNPERAIQAVQRPPEGWLRAFRHALGLSLKSVAGRLKVSPQAIHQLEKSEEAGTISLGQLESVAGAMGCRVAYAIVPRQGSLAELAGPAGGGANQAGAP